MSFVAELRRRQVFRTAGWYGGFAWLAVEVASTVFPQFGLPAWGIRAVIVAALLGLPVALALAWSFDLTRAGVHRENETPAPAAPQAPFAVWRVPSFWVALILGAGLAASAQQAWKRLVRPAGDRATIAVLPFANLSPDPENAYFADGLQEEVLTTLARAGSLRVISRTSVEQYRDPKRNLTEIAGALGADLILEGSVRRSGDDLRLALQLIDGRSDEHLWAETYERKFQNALHLQATIAEQVVAAIGATLSPAERLLIDRSAPTVPEAYDAYLQALATKRPFGSSSDHKAVLALLDQSIALDSNFAPAYALRAKTRIALLAENTYDTALAEGARADIERALELEPGLPDGLVARGLYHTYVSTDPERAIEDLNRALSLVPSDADAHDVAGMTLRRLGRFDEAIEHFNTAARLSPAEPGFAMMGLETLSRLGRVEEAETVRQALLPRFPNHFFLRLIKYYNQFQATGDTTGWRNELESVSDSSEEYRAGFSQMLLLASNDLAGYVGFVETHPDTPCLDTSRDFCLGTAYLAMGDDQRARPHLDAVLADMSAHPDDFLALSSGAVALELLGRSTEAIHAADRAVELRPEKTDVLNGTWVAMQRAWVLIHSKVRAEEGYREFERLLGSIDQQPRWVAASPVWLLLRDDARVQQIIQSRLSRT